MKATIGGTEGWEGENRVGSRTKNRRTDKTTQKKENPKGIGAAFPKVKIIRGKGQRRKLRGEKE